MQSPVATLRHLRAPRPLIFPTEAEMPETKRHLTLRTALYDVLMTALGARASVGSEQFIYWNARDPGRCLAPDGFVKLGVPDTDFPSWKTWERGTPELAIEILSDSDDRRGAWEEKLERYHELGVRELVAFDGDAAAGARLRIWDRVADDLVEREIDGDAAASTTLGAFFVVGRTGNADVALRIADDREGASTWPTSAEAEAAKASARIAELEEALRRR
jgi:hypothetical protein